jgi:hypothetical protein
MESQMSDLKELHAPFVPRSSPSPRTDEFTFLNRMANVAHWVLPLLFSPPLSLLLSKKEEEAFPSSF